MPLAVLFAMLGMGCASGPTSKMLVAGAEATLRPGESARLPDDSRITYAGVASDSRCPPAVACIHAGSARVSFGHEAPGASPAAIEVVMPESPRARVGNWMLTLARLEHGSSPSAVVTVDPAR